MFQIKQKQEQDTSQNDYLELLKELLVCAYNDQKDNSEYYLSAGDFEGSFFSFYPTLFDGGFPILGNHLWFLVLLFVFALITVNLFSYLRKEKQQEKIVSFLSNPRVLIIFPVPILISEILYADLTDLPLFGGWNFFSHLLFFIYGFILAFNHDKLLIAIENQVKKLAIANGLSIALLLAKSLPNQHIAMAPPLDL